MSGLTKFVTVNEFKTMTGEDCNFCCGIGRCKKPAAMIKISYVSEQKAMFSNTGVCQRCYDRIKRTIETLRG